MNIPLKVLTDAVAAMQMLRDVADSQMNTEQFMQAMRSYSSLSSYVNCITNEIKVEVEA